MNKFFKVLVIALCVVLLVAGSVAATLAYLTMKTESVQNTFTAGNISIALEQTEELDVYNHKMMPGVEYTVDPVVTVAQGSEACWLFIKIDEKINEPAKFEDYLTYELADGWIYLEPGVYYREVEATTDTAKTFDIIKDNKVIANADRTKAEYNALNTQSLNLNFTAYAVQHVGFETAAAAWAEAETLDNTPETGTETENPENKG